MPDSRTPDGPGPDDRLTERDLPAASDEELAEVRRLLQAARVETPTPSEVVARLDATLADLVAERAGSPEHVSVDTLTAAGDHDQLAARRARRRRFLTGVGLVAAASVVAAGFLGQLLTAEQSDTSSAGNSTETSQESMAEAPADAGQPDEAEAAPSAAPEAASPPLNSEFQLLESLPVTEDEARAVLVVLAEISASGYTAEPGARQPLQRERDGAVRCGEWSSRATLVPVTIDGEDRVLALPPRADSGDRTVHLLDCTAPTAVDLQTFEVPAP